MKIPKAFIYGIWSPCYIRVGSDEGALKIGKAVDVQQRFQNIQCANPLHLFILWKVPVLSSHIIELEHRIHEALEDRNLRGEWFWFKTLEEAYLYREEVCELMEDLYADHRFLNGKKLPTLSETI